MDVLDVDRTLRHARTARGAGPQQVVVDDAVLLDSAEEGPLGLRERGRRDVLELLRGRLVLALHGLAAVGEQVMRLGVRVVAHAT